MIKTSKTAYWSLAAVLFLIPVFVLAQSAPKTSVPEFTKTMFLGMQGNDVKLLQEFLSHDPEIYSEGLITGYFGLKTQTAVKKWQQKHGVEPVGIVGPKTIIKIKEIRQAETEAAVVIKEPTLSTTTVPETAVLTTPADTTPPTVTLAIRNPAPTSVYIQLTPSEEVTAVYEYGLTPEYGSLKEALNQYSASTTATSLENLISSTTYHIRVQVTDRSGNIGYSKNYIFTTPGLDDAPVLTYGPYVIPSNATPPTAVSVSWGTNIPCVGIFHYGGDATFTNAKTNDYTATDHKVVITGLAPGAVIVAQVSCATTKKTFHSDNFIFTATSTNNSNATSLISNPFLANILKILSGVIQKFKIR